MNAKSSALTAAAAAVTLLAGFSTQLAHSQEAPAEKAGAGSIKPDGTVVVPSFELPPSIYLSDEARKAIPRKPTDQEAQMRQMLAAGMVPAIRPKIGQYMAPQIDRLKALYPVTTREAVIAGVPAIHVTPASGVPKANAKKILLNLPGGGFVMGMAAGTGMVESIPLASLARAEIVSITYRQAPEAKYPAATEDVVAVYRELLKTHKPQDIAVFGCSAGGLLTAEAIAAFIKEKLPLPAAIGIFCASADGRWGGDSRAFARPFQALESHNRSLGYFEGANLEDPQVSPVVSTDLLKRFPPTLLTTATRAMEMSAAVNTHRELVKAGVMADLHVWDGLGHAFFYDPGLPESREAFDVMTGFFQKHLKLAK
ncbi:alpha/beta hydrolase fold domain-containing protein [Caulobacter sp. DWR1-3-2b1]|uniref:alpha/beta hydrolase fold domain-containing protein n=1 Tax=Caulobacter sp. DWR1-3-2b1 TaxID=2804670 RepID=UPI003CF136D9